MAWETAQSLPRFSLTCSSGGAQPSPQTPESSWYFSVAFIRFTIARARSTGRAEAPAIASSALLLAGAAIAVSRWTPRILSAVSKSHCMRQYSRKVAKKTFCYGLTLGSDSI